MHHYVVVTLYEGKPRGAGTTYPSKEEAKDAARRLNANRTPYFFYVVKARGGAKP